MQASSTKNSESSRVRTEAQGATVPADVYTSVWHSCLTSAVVEAWTANHWGEEVGLKPPLTGTWWIAATVRLIQGSFKRRVSG